MGQEPATSPRVGRAPARPRAPSTGPVQSTTLSPDRVLGNTAITALVQAGRAAPDRMGGVINGLQRRELSNSRVSQVYQDPGAWELRDRIGNTDRWKAACEHNLLNLRHEDYTTIPQRRDFYHWFYEATAARGYHTRWALAAWVVASGMAEMAALDYTEGVSPVTNELQGLARIGNQVIFDDVLPKLKRLWENGPVTGAAALQADARILADEQSLVQAMYDGLSEDTMERFAGIANNSYWRTQGGRAAGLGGSVEGGGHHVGGDVPSFSDVVPGGDITQPEDRWRYGMGLGEEFSTLPSPGDPGSMPTPGASYTSGEEFERLNVRPHLHQLDARLNDTDIPEDEVIALLAQLDTTTEQPELLGNSWRVFRLVNALNADEMSRGVRGLTGVPLVARMDLLRRAAGGSWGDLDYDDVGPVVRSAPSSQRHGLHSATWKTRFLDICDDDTIVTATVDLDLPADVARAWRDTEEEWF